MGSYGRNFEMRITPTEQQRRGRILLDGSAPVAIGAPLVIANGATPSEAFTKALPANLATGAQPFKRGFTGVGIYEHLDYNQYDPEWILYSDRDVMPQGKLVQLIIGPNVKVVFRNTEDRTYLGTRDYEGRVMVAGLGATPTVAVGDYLTPGTGNDDAGYWAETGSAANAWLVVTNVDAARQEVEAELL